MSRTPRRPRISADSGEGREIGLDDRELPGGLPHISNAETHQSKAAVPARRHVPNINEHRVPDADPDAAYELPEAGKVKEPRYAPPVKEEYALPVYIRAHPGKAPQHTLSMGDQILVPATGNDPFPLCGKDYKRFEVQLLNEDAANDIRWSHERDILIEGKGALLKHGATSYTKIRTQDEVWVIGVTNACLLSTIITTDVNN